jgi:TIR domain
MSDIFISYSKTDHAEALKLSAFLEAEGWSVWYDKNLGAADLYRDKIMTQLAAARAVITIWTPNSIRSDWVRAEAGRAKADGKLIPVKTPDVAYGDIPLPFGEMHTENIGSTDLIRAAVVAQLAKPTVEPTTWALLGKGFRYELLTWVGIVGGALTLFTNLGAVLKLADWARVFVEHWKELTHAFWLWAFGWLGIHLPPEWTPVLSFLLFGSLLTIGQAVKFQITIRSKAIVEKNQGKSFQLITRRAILCMICTLIAGIVWFYGWGYILSAVLSDRLERGLPLPIMMIAIAGTLIFLPMSMLVMMFARDRVHAFMASFLMGISFVIITLLPWDEIVPATTGSANVAFHVGIFLMSVVPIILLSVAPAKAISRRLIFLALGLLLLIALNELSKLVHYWGVTL